MKLNEVKSVGKKITFVVLCVVLLLIFTSLSYGWGPNPKYDRLREHPWEHALSSKPDNNQTLNLVVLVINSHFYLIFKSQSKVENFNEVGNLTDQKSASSKKRGSLNIHETKSKE